MHLVENSHQIYWEAAFTAVRGAVEEAQRLSIRINAAVVDCGCNCLAFVRMNGAPLHSAEIAKDKACTSASFQVSSADLGTLVESNRNLYDGLVRRNSLVLFAGGFPIVIDGQCVGGIGVSGATEKQDQQCARAGLRSIGVGP